MDRNAAGDSREWRKSMSYPLVRVRKHHDDKMNDGRIGHKH